MCKRRQHIRSVFVKKYEKYDFKFDSAVLICGLLIIADRKIVYIDVNFNLITQEFGQVLSYECVTVPFRMRKLYT